MTLSTAQFDCIDVGYHDNPSRSMSLRAMAHTDAAWYGFENISLLQSVPRGRSSPAVDGGAIINDPVGARKPAHAVHHFHALVRAHCREVVR